MCLADNYLEQIQSIIVDFHNKEKRLREQYSTCDKAVIDLYHQIEMSNFNACEGYFYAKRLQEVLRKRRAIKMELQKLQSFNDNINLNYLKNAINKTKKKLKNKEVNTKHWKQNWNCTYTIDELIN